VRSTFSFFGRLVTPVVIAGLVLVGCGGNQVTQPKANVPVDPSKPVSGGVFTKSLNYGDPGNLDPIMKSDVAARMVNMNIVEGLVNVNPVTKKTEGRIAEKWEPSADGKTYTFTIKKGVKFHNGREVKAADIKYSFERSINPKNAAVTAKQFDLVVGAADYVKGTAQDVKGFEVKGDYQFVVTLTDVKPTFLLDLSSPAAGIVPKEEVDKAGADFGQKPIGTGPFKLGEWKKDDKIVLERFADYHGEKAYLDQVVFRIMKEEATRDAEFQAGTLDAMVIGEALYKRYSADPSKSKGLVEVPELFTRAIHFNTTKAPFDNVKVRQAINHAIDKAAVVDKVLNNKAYVATGALQSSSPGYNKDLKGYEFSADKAKALLKEAGFEQGFEMEVLVTSVTAKWMEAMTTYLQPLGIKVKITQLEGSTLLGRARKGDYQAVIFSTGGDLDPISFLGRFHSKNHGAPGNVTLYTNKQVDQLLDEAAKTIEDAKRIELARKAEEIVVKEAPWFFFNYNKAVMIAQPHVQGLQKIPTDVDFQDLSKVWLAKQ
jgi:peptide/nickel transport system substrate-binding protein